MTINADHRHYEYLIGACVLRPAMAKEILSVVRDDDFPQPNQKIVRVMREMTEREEPITLLNLEGKLNGDFKTVLSCVESAKNGALSPAVCLSYARRVSDWGMRLRLGGALARGLANVENEPDLEKAMTILFDELAREKGNTTSKGFITPQTGSIELLNKLTEWLDNPQKGAWGMSTGFATLDKILGGLEDESLYLLAARPSVGKTSFALQMANNIASRKIPVAFFSLEMSEPQLRLRLLCLRGGYDSMELRSGMRRAEYGAKREWTSDEIAQMVNVQGELSELPIYINPKGGISVSESRMQLSEAISKFGIKAVFFDYIQLGTSQGENQNIRVSKISEGLKTIAKDFHIPVVALSQLSRAVESRDSKIPMLSDLRDSGSLEQDADVVIFLHRDDVTNRGKSDTYGNPIKANGKADVVVAKNRNGATGRIEMVFNETTTTFSEVTQ